MENIFLEKIQTTVNQRKHIYNNVLSEVPHTIKSRILTIKIVATFFVEEPTFLFHVSKRPTKHEAGRKVFQRALQRGEVGTSNHRVESD